MSTMLGLLGAVAAAAPATTLSSHDPQTVVAYLQAEGYRAKLEAKGENKDPSVGPWIETGESGTTIVISFLNCTNKRQCADISFTSAWDTADGKGPSLAALQQWNADKRFTKAYLDGDKDPVLEMDLLFTEGRLDSRTFDNAFGIFVSSIADFEKVIGWDEPEAAPSGNPDSTAP